MNTKLLGACLMAGALMLLCPAAPATAQVSIGVNFSLFPDLVQVPGYPVYYAPRLNSNYFFYDGMYWVYQGDNWYASSWYNGPWDAVDPEDVPLYVLRIPVRYYREPPEYFRGWQANAPPRWGDHWGHEWEQRRSGWDKWNHASAPRPAPLPVYQRQYSGNRYPKADQQNALRAKNYHYQPREAVVRQHYQEHAAQKAPAPAERGAKGTPQERNAGPQGAQHSKPAAHAAPATPRAQPAEKEGPPAKKQSQRPQEKAAQHQPPPEKAAQRPQPQEKAAQRPQPKEKAAQRPQPQEKAAQRPQPQEKAAQRPQLQEKAAQRPQPQGKAEPKGKEAPKEQKHE